MRKLLTFAGIAALTSTTALAMPSMNTYGYTDFDQLPEAGAVKISGMVQQRYDADTFDLVDADGTDIDVHTQGANNLAPGTFVTVEGTVSSDVAGLGNEVHAARVTPFDARQASWSNYVAPTAYNTMPSVPGNQTVTYPDPNAPTANATRYEAAESNVGGWSANERYEQQAGTHAQRRMDYNPDISQDKAPNNHFDPTRIDDSIDVAYRLPGGEPRLHNYDPDVDGVPNDPSELTATARGDYVLEDRTYDANRANPAYRGTNTATLSDFDMLRNNSNVTVTGEVASIVDGDTFILRDREGETIDVHTASTAGLRVGEVITLDGQIRNEFMGLGQEIRATRYDRATGQVGYNY